MYSSLVNETSAQNSSVEVHNLTMANNTSENITFGNNTTGQNSSIEAQNVTENTAVNATAKKCFKKWLLRRKAFVKTFNIEYSDNGILWKLYHEGGYVKVFVLIKNSRDFHSHFMS